MTRIVVLGYGNPLRGDDGVGWRVAEAVAERWAEHVEVRTGQQLVPEWAIDLQEVDIAYFVDASLVVDAPELQSLSPDLETPPVANHDLDPAQLLRMTRLVYGRAPAAFVLHVPAVNFDYGDALSPVAANGVGSAVSLLNDVLHAALTPRVGEKSPAIRDRE